MAAHPSKTMYSANLLARNLSAVSNLSSTERDLLMGMQHRAEVYAPGSEISAAHAKRPRPRLIVSGWAGRQRVLPNGRCQLLSVLLPGDVIGISPGRRPLDEEAIIAINNISVISIAPILAAIVDNPVEFSETSRGLSIMAQAEDLRILDSLVRLGCQTALERTANFIIELFERCSTIGFVNNSSFLMPLTQEIIGTALGISSVHVNRILGQLKKEKSISFNNGQMTILNLRSLRNCAESFCQSLDIARINSATLLPPHSHL
jgi:CRP-like cAMP-binding protein